MGCGGLILRGEDYSVFGKARPLEVLLPHD